MGFGFLESWYEKRLLIEFRKVKLKCTSRKLIIVEVQLVNYLVSTGKPVGFLLDFWKKKVDDNRKQKELN